MSSMDYETDHLGKEGCKAWVCIVNAMGRHLIEGGADKAKAVEFLGGLMSEEVVDFLLNSPGLIEEGSPADMLLVGLVADESVGDAELANAGV